MNKTPQQHTKEAVLSIVDDLSDRQGFDGIWDSIDEEGRAEIRETWEGLVMRAVELSSRDADVRRACEAASVDPKAPIDVSMLPGVIRNLAQQRDATIDRLERAERRVTKLETALIALLMRIDRFGDRWPLDGACPECLPEGGSMVDENFRCARHAARAALAPEAAKVGDK